MGNGWTETTSHASLLPDSLLLYIFQFLDWRQLCRIAPICSQWNRVSKDEPLWKRIFLLDFGLRKETTKLRVEAVGWYEEYKRLIWEGPVHLTQTIKWHGDEILHVSFSPDGSLLASCSKDATVKVWAAKKNVVEYMMERDLREMLKWKYTQFSEFNSAGCLLLVSGVHKGPHNTQGEIAVFQIDLETKRLGFRCRVLNRPYDVFGCWFNGGHVLSGELTSLGAGLCSVSHLHLCKASQDTHDERISVLAPLVRFLNRNASNVRMVLSSSHVTPALKSSIIFARKEKEMAKSKKSADLSAEEFLAIYSSISEEMELDCRLQPCGNCEGEDCSMDGEQSEFCECLCHESVKDRLLMFSTGSLTYTPHQVGFKLIRGPEVAQKLSEEVMSDERRDKVHQKMKEYREQKEREMEAEQAAGPDAPPGDDDEEEMEEGEEGDPEDIFDQPDDILEMHGHVIGMALTLDRRYLLVNVRPWPADVVEFEVWEPPPISNEIEVRIVDLETLTLLEGVRFRAHKGFTPNQECFFIFLDGNDSWIASGSEDCKGYVWSRDYGCVLGELDHESVVNSVALNPADPQMLVSASDDFTLRVWRSKAEIASQRDHPTIDNDFIQDNVEFSEAL